MPKKETKRLLRSARFVRHAISFPFIWLMVLPAIVLHAGMVLYQAICFRLYGIKRVRLRAYINFDREKLGYLSLFDKINCAYCSYVNGLLAYAGEIGHRTEYYWCGVKHCNQPDNSAFAYQEKFACYGSREDYERVLVESGRFVKR